MIRRTTGITLAIGLALAAAAFAQDTFSLKRVAKVGDELRYALSVDADFGGQQLQISATVIDRVTEIAEDGAYTVASTQAETKIRFGDQEMPMDQEATTTTKFAANGTVIEIKGDQVDSSSYRMGAMNTLLVPPASVKVGDKWSWEAKSDPKTGMLAGKADYEVLAVEEVGGRPNVKIAWSFKETEGGEPASMVGTAWIDAADGALTKLEAKVDDAPLPGAPGPVDLTIKLERKG